MWLRFCTVVDLQRIPGLVVLYKVRKAQRFSRCCWYTGVHQAATWLTCPTYTHVRSHSYGYPALIALTPDTAKFATLRSAFEPQPLADFVDDLRQARPLIRPSPFITSTRCTQFFSKWIITCDFSHVHVIREAACCAMYLPHLKSTHVLMSRGGLGITRAVPGCSDRSHHQP